MISNLNCIDIHKEYFDEIDEDSIFTRNEECKHFEISMRRISENFKFKKYSLTIECKNCNYSIKKNLTKNEDNISYYCEKCNMPQICINFVYQNTMPITQKIYNTPEQKEIEIIFKYINKKAKISLYMFEPLERQCGIIKKTFNIKNEKNINIIENSDVIDLQKSPKDLNWTSGMEMEIEINN